MKLREWQESLQLSILDANPHLQAASCDDPVLDEKRHAHKLAIYQNAYRLRLIEALRTNYPVLHLVLGDVVFSQLGLHMVAASPPAHASIRWFGHDLAHYLGQFEPFSALPVLADLARFEWSLRHTVDATEAKRWSETELAQLPADEWVNLQFHLHPSVSRLRLGWNALEVWQALMADANAPPPAPTRAPMHWLIWRSSDQSTQWRSADAQEFKALQRIAEGASFAQLCEQQLENNEGETPEAQVAPRVASWLKGWVKDELLVQVQV